MKKALALVLALLSPLAAQAATECPQHYLGGREPSISNPSMRTKTRELCFSEYGSMWSGASRTPLWSASHLTRDRVAASHGLPRTNDFHEETRLSPEDRSWMSDFSRSGFDRGHVAPNGDMSNPASQSESFSLANMVPQVAENNRGIWAGIESTVRDLASRSGEVWVVTGPVFSGSTLRTTPSRRVFVPTHMFKAIYVPSTGQSGVYLSPNDTSGSWTPISVDQLATMTGFDPFPGLSSGRSVSMALPQPRGRTQY